MANKVRARRRGYYSLEMRTKDMEGQKIFYVRMKE